MRVVFLQKSAGRGGAKNSLVESLSAIRSDGTLSARVLVGETGPLIERCRRLDVACDIVQLPEWRKLFERMRFAPAMHRIAARLAEDRVDWIVSNEMWWAPHASRIARLLGCRSAVILRDGIATVRKSRQYRLYENDKILPVSTTIMQGLAPDPALAQRTRVLFNSVRLPSAGDLKEELAARVRQFPAVHRWLVMVGRVGFRKNQADAVRTVRNLIAGGHSGVGLILAGDIDSDYAPVLNEVIDQCGLTDRVLCLGNFEDIRSLLDIADSVLLTSTREGLPRSIVESLLARRPAYAYPCEGVEDIYEEKLRQFVSGEGTPEALSALICEGWRSESKVAMEVAELHQRILTRFSPEAHLESLRRALGAGD